MTIEHLTNLLRDHAEDGRYGGCRFYMNTQTAKDLMARYPKVNGATDWERMVNIELGARWPMIGLAGLDVCIDESMPVGEWKLQGVVASGNLGRVAHVRTGE